MEFENKYSSNAKGNLGVTLGSIALGTSLLGCNGLNLFGNNGCNGCGDNAMVNRYELSLHQELSAKDSRIGLLESNIYTDSKIADVYERLNNKIAVIESAVCQQNVYNTSNTSALACLQGQVAQLMSLTKMVIPNTSVCPGWGDVTVSPATTTTGA